MLKKSFLILVFVIVTFPVYFMFIGGFQSMVGIQKMPPNLIPYNPVLSNYTTIFAWPVLVWLKNTLIVTIFTVMFSVLLCSMSGYAFALYPMKYKKILWGALLLGIMIPRISLVIPTYVIIRQLGISGTLQAVILPIVYYPVGMYLARIYFETIPISLLESARLDGANEWQILTKIIMPISKPILTCLALFSSINALQDYIWQMLVLQKDQVRTLLVGLIQVALRRGDVALPDGTHMTMNVFGVGLASGTLLFLPLLLMFLVANKYFTQSLNGADGVKE
jgi:ABC-type glycerol-3-phosphate transport system permease component